MTVSAAMQNSNGSCVSYNRFWDAIHVLGIISTEGLLILRTYAFWERSKKVLAWLIVSAALCIAAAFVLSSEIDTKNTLNPTGCLFTGSNTSAIQYSLLVFFESLLLSLTAYRMVKHYRSSKSTVVIKFYRGSMIYTGCIISVTLSNVIGLLTFPFGYTELFDSLQLVVHSVLASRVLFNLRESDARAHNIDTSISMLPTLSTVRFQSATLAQREELGEVIVHEGDARE